MNLANENARDKSLCNIVNGLNPGVSVVCRPGECSSEKNCW